MWFLEDLSLPKILLVLLIGIILFGPKKLPELGRSLAQGIRGFKGALTEPEAPEETHPSEK